MKSFINISIILLFSLKLSAQTKLTIFSEDNNIFIANLDDKVIANEGSNFFEFTDINIDTVILKIVLDNNQKLKKTIELKNGKHNVYSIANENGFYKIRYRGYYGINTELPDFENRNDWVYTSETVLEYPFITEVDGESEVESYQNKLVNVNTILGLIEGISDDKERTSIIVDELNKGKYNCRQLKFLFTKINTDYSKLYTFKSTVNSCLDKENLMTIKSSFKSKKYQAEFNKLVSTL